jgi:murein DD-endopeptidase MepM/ murein hydrolase activator NlpD
MQSSGVRARIRELAEKRPAFLLSIVGMVAAGAAAASPLSQPGIRAGVVQKAVAVVAAQAVAEPPKLELVWQGKDVDGDGRDDFCNPTGEEARGHDAYGEGEFGARRDGGSRRHEGVDFMARAGQAVAAPISGYVSKIGYAYAGDQTLKFIEITNPALNYAARVFYVNPAVQVGEAVAVGTRIGTAHSLQRKYPGGMTDHVHLEIIDKGGDRIDAAKMIVASYEPAETLGATTVAAAD